MWDAAPDCPGLVLVWDGSDVHAFSYAPSTVRGPLVSKLGPVEIGRAGEITVSPEAHPLPPNCSPILSLSGEITCQDALGNLTVVTAPHLVPPHDPDSTVQQRFAFTQVPPSSPHRNVRLTF